MTREEAIKIIRKMLACTDLTVRANLNADMVSACNLAIKALEQEPKTEWIPVSEKLPENKTYVLVTISIPGRQPHARSGWYQDGFFYNDNGDCWRATDIEVKAWMPLPKPYEPQESEE